MFWKKEASSEHINPLKVLFQYLCLLIAIIWPEKKEKEMTISKPIPPDGLYADKDGKTGWENTTPSEKNMGLSERQLAEAYANIGEMNPSDVANAVGKMLVMRYWPVVCVLLFGLLVYAFRSQIVQVSTWLTSPSHTLMVTTIAFIVFLVFVFGMVWETFKEAQPTKKEMIQDEGEVEDIVGTQEWMLRFLVPTLITLVCILAAIATLIGWGIWYYWPQISTFVVKNGADMWIFR